MGDVAVFVAYLAFLILVLIVGDILGCRLRMALSCRRFTRCTLPSLPKALSVSFVLLLPGLIFIMAFVIAWNLIFDRNIETMIDNLELIIPVVFFVTGLLGGIIAGGNKRNQ